MANLTRNPEKSPTVSAPEWVNLAPQTLQFSLMNSRSEEYRSLHNQIDDQAAAVRARWMAELAAAIEGAQRVAWQLGSAMNASLEARELYGRLEAPRVELESLRRGTRRLREEIDPWLVEQLGWPGTLQDRDPD